MNSDIEYKIVLGIKYSYKLDEEVNKLLNEVHKEYYWSTIGGVSVIPETEGAYAKFYQAMIRNPRIYK